MLPQFEEKEVRELMKLFKKQLRPKKKGGQQQRDKECKVKKTTEETEENLRDRYRLR